MIYYTYIDSRVPVVNKLITEWSTEEDRLHAEKRKNKVAARNSLAARALLRKNISYNGKISISDSGKPFIEAGPNISISHSVDMVAVAWCEQALVGIDIEKWRVRDFAKLANYAFGPDEQKTEATEFYKIWTIREAVAKATGDSVFTGMGKNIDTKKWQILTALPVEGYSLAVAAENKKLEFKRV